MSKVELPVLLPEELFTVSQVAAILRIDPRQVRDLVARGELASIRVGSTGMHRFTREAIEVVIKR